MKKLTILLCIISFPLLNVYAQMSADLSIGRNSATYIVETATENWTLKQKAVQKDSQGLIYNNFTLKLNFQNLQLSFTNPTFAGNDMKDLALDFKGNNTDFYLYWLYLEKEKAYPILEEETDDYVRGNNMDFDLQFKSKDNFLSTSSVLEVKYRELDKLKISTYLEGSAKLSQLTLSANVRHQNYDKWAKTINASLSTTNMEILYSFSEGHPPVFGGTSRLYESFFQSCFTQGLVKMQTKSSLSYSSDGGKVVNTDYTLGIGALSLSVTADRTIGSLKQLKSPKLQLDFEDAGFSVYSNKVFVNITLRGKNMSININQDRTVRIYLTFET